MPKARHLVHEAELAAVLAVALVVALAFIDPALAVVVAIMLIGLLVLIVPLVAVLYDQRQSRPLRH
jgi:ABC-type transport system involved in cytochrome bd biosynthesis fused ATPase/permease subunit